MRKLLFGILLLVLVLGSWGGTKISATPKISGDFQIISPEFNFSDKQKWMIVEYWLNDFVWIDNSDTLYIDVLKLNTTVWPLPCWVDKTYYLSEKRYNELFDREFNTMYAESEAKTYSLKVPKKSGEKQNIRIDVDPYYDYLVSMSFIRNTGENFKTGFKLIGGNYLELSPWPDIRCEMASITKNSATIICMPQMFYASTKDFANITLEIIDMQADKLIPPIVSSQKASIRAIRNPDQAPPWCAPADYISFEIKKLLAGHTYMAKITSVFPNRFATVQKIFTTLK